MGLYSEPVYAYPQSVPHPPSVAPPPLPPHNGYGTLPRRPPRPVDPEAWRAARLEAEAAEDEDAAMGTEAATLPMGSASTQRRRRTVRWSQEDLLLCTPPQPTRPAPTLRSDPAQDYDDDEEEEAETTLDDEDEDVPPGDAPVKPPQRPPRITDLKRIC